MKSIDTIYQFVFFSKNTKSLNDATDIEYSTF